MYSFLLIAHSWLRWFAIAGVALVFLRALRGSAASSPWTRTDVVWSKSAAHILTLQAVLGIILYVTSPYIKGLLGDMSTTMHDKTSRLFAVEHGVVMILALGLTHMGTAIAKKGATDKAKHTRIAIFFGIALLLMGYAIPWLRPFFRTAA